MSGSSESLWRRVDAGGIPLLVCRVVLGVLFIVMGLAKTGTLKMAVHAAGIEETALVQRLADEEDGIVSLSDPVAFMKLIREYDMVPGNVPVLLNLLAAVLPWLEVMCGVLLLLGVALRGTAAFLLVMLVGFTAVVTLRAIGIYNAGEIPFCSIKFDCGCGAGKVFICAKIAENTTSALLSLYVLLSRSRRFCLRARLV
jgi:uncharacterized membrane protein YphA (DoxX/SURF4 family)